MSYLAVFILSLTIFTSGCTKSPPPSAPSDSKGAKAEGHQDPDGYYTCPMHTQVHQHESGPCPICGMALVKVKPQNKVNTSGATSTPGVNSTDSQLSLAGISKHKVERKNLIFTVPVSGRFLSSREIAFQIYEADLAVIKYGVTFTGSPVSAPTENLTGTIRSIDNLIDPASRTSRVIGTLGKAFPNAPLEGGFQGQIKIELNGQIAIPEDAVLHTGLKDLVYVVGDDNKLKPVAVLLGKRAGSDYQVLSGLEEGQIISRGSNFLIDSEAKIRGSAEND